MTTYVITAEMEILFGEYLEQDEKSKNTIEKYRRDLRKFVEYIDGEEVTKELVIGFKEYLVEHYAVNSVNSIIASLNRFMQFAGWQEFRVKQLKKQRQVYCPEEKELTKQEYFELIRTAKREGKEKIGLIIQTIGSTGIRISELPSITVQAVKNGVAQVDCKGKNRQVLLPRKLLVKLMHYIRKEHIQCGPIFITKQGNPLDRSNIWKEMKKRYFPITSDTCLPIPFIRWKRILPNWQIYWDTVILIRRGFILSLRELNIGNRLKR